MVRIQTGKIVLVAAAIVPSGLAYAAAIGLGVHRHGAPWAVSVAATVGVFLPGVLVSTTTKHDRVLSFAGAQLLWVLVFLLAMPVYFPGERREAVSTGLSVLMGSGEWSDLAEQVADALPEEPEISSPEIALAAEIPVAEVLPARALGEHEIALPYEGEGRNLTIPVVFQHGSQEVELSMLLDTGATYTTLSRASIEALGVEILPSSPVIHLRTANGDRDAQIVSLDAVWLGDLELRGVSVATCDECESKSSAGLLGLNVAGAYNMAIDADRREVTFSRRSSYDRKLDIKPFVHLDARFSRYPGGRVEVEVELENNGDREIGAASAEVRCDTNRWTVKLGAIGAGGLLTKTTKLPRHEVCDAYVISLHHASWAEE